MIRASFTRWAAGAAILVTAVIQVEGALSAPGDKLCVKKEFMTTGIEVKAKPDSKSETVMVIGSGRMVIEFSRVNGWVFAGVHRAGGKDGYVPASALSTKDLDGMPCNM